MTHYRTSNGVTFWSSECEDAVVARISQEGDCEMSDMFDLVRNSEPLSTITYCVAKRGEYHFDEWSKPSCIADCKTFEELKMVLILIYSADDGVLSEECFDSATRDMNFPVLDRLLRWPWDENYERILDKPATTV